MYIDFDNWFVAPIHNNLYIIISLLFIISFIGKGIWMFFNRQLKIQDLGASLPFDVIRKRARILVIDDDEQAFPYKLLQNEGYNVTYWPSIKNLRDLESGEYDLIVLDICGVAESCISTSDGLGILDHLKKNNPAQLIIAYSGQKYDLSLERFWRLADDYLGKPSPLITCKEKIDSLLRNYFTPDHYWQTIVECLRKAGIQDKHIRNYENNICSKLKKGTIPDTMMLQNYTAIGHHTIALINSLIQIIARLNKPI